MGSSPYKDNIPKELLRIEPFSRHYYFKSKEEINLHIKQLEQKLSHLNERLQGLRDHHFPGRIITDEFKTLERGKDIIEDDIAYLKEQRRTQFGKKRGRKPSKRKAKRKSKKHKGKKPNKDND